MRTKTKNKTYFKTICLLHFFFLFSLFPIWASPLVSSDSLGCEVESVIFECQGPAANRAAAEAWHQRNFDWLKENCIGRDSGSLILTSAGLGNQNFCGGCTIYGGFQIIDWRRGVVTKSIPATFEIVDNTPPVFLDSTHDTIQCNFRHPIFGWEEGVQNHSRVSDCSLTWSIGFRSSQLIEKTEKTKVYKYVISLTDSYRNTGFETIYLTVLDTTPPAITCNPDDLKIACNGQQNNQTAASEWNEANLTKLKNCSREYCSDVFVTSDFDVNEVNSNCELVVTYSITDEFNNVSTRTATLMIMDSTPPLINCNWGGKTVLECTQQFPIKPQLIEFHNQNLLILEECSFDNCGNFEITHDFDPSLFRDDCESGPVDLAINYFVTDNCGNTTSVTRQYNIVYRDMVDELCTNLNIQGTNNQLVISPLTAPITIAKVYNQQYELMYECNINSICPETVTIPNLTEGETYFTDIQFFSEDFTFICQDKQEVIIEGGNEPCDTSICQGDVILRTQAEVDAFCGCEVIEGKLQISGNTVVSLANLATLRQVKGFLSIAGTQLENLLGLERLTYVGEALYIGTNENLISLLGINQLKNIESNLVIDTNKRLKNLDELGVELVKIINISSNDSLENIVGLNSPEGVTSISITNNDQLLTLDGLNGITSLADGNIRGGGFSSLTIGGNDALISVEALEKLILAEENITINFNTALADCCSITKLIDSDSTNGRIIGQIFIDNNLVGCNSIEEILQSCQTPSPTCENIQILTQNNQITITGLTVPNEIVKVFDKDYNILYECNGNCEETQIVGTFPAGNYIIDLQLYDENWQQICVEQRPITLENDTPCDNAVCSIENSVFVNLPQSPTIDCQNDRMEYCLAISMDSLESYEIMVNGMPYDGIINSCKYTESFAYTYFTLPVKNGDSEYRLNNWTIDNQSFSTDFNNIQQLADSMNTWDKASRWTLNEELIIIEGGDVTVDYGSLDIVHLESAESSILSLNNNVGIDGIAINLSIQNNEIEIFNKHKTCSEKIKVQAKCISCDEAIPLVNESMNYQERRLNGSCQNTYTLIRTSDKIGDCDKTFKSVEFIRIEDITAPVLDNVADITINENEIIPNISATATDNCDGDVTISYEVIPNDDFTQWTRIFTATDNCSNTATAQQIITIIQDGNNLCDALEITTTNNEIRFKNIDAPNSIVKVFDANYQIIFDCTATCENELIVPVVGEGIYHTDVQFYDEYWAFICEDKQDVLIESSTEPCDTSICAGDVFLRTQAQVDAFCGCEVIEGDLLIGTESNNSFSDISSLRKLSLLKRVNGSITIVSNLFDKFDGLSNLNYVEGTFAFSNNSNLQSLAGLEKMQYIGDQLVSFFNPNLLDMSALNSLTQLKGGIVLNDSGVETIDFLSNLENNQLRKIEITNCDNLQNLTGLESIQRVMQTNPLIATVVIGGNDKLVNLEGIKNINLIEGSLIITANIALNDCCSIAHLVDMDTDNGFVSKIISIRDNNNLCSSIETILENCGDVSAFDCSEVNIQNGFNSVTISNLNAPIQIVKVFDNNYATVYECFAECEETINLPDLAAGRYHVNINFYDENWNPICERIETVQVEANTEDRNTQLLPADFTLYPNPAEAETFIDLGKLKGESVQLILYNQFGQKISQQDLEKTGEDKVKIDLSTISNGLYILQIAAKGRRNISKKLVVNKLY